MEHPGKTAIFKSKLLLTLRFRSRLDGAQVNAKRLLTTWTLHFAAKTTVEAV